MSSANNILLLNIQPSCNNNLVLELKTVFENIIKSFLKCVLGRSVLVLTNVKDYRFDNDVSSGFRILLLL